MRWGSGDGPWVRPVHGVVALFDGEVVPFELFGVAGRSRVRGAPDALADRLSGNGGRRLSGGSSARLRHRRRSGGAQAAARWSAMDARARRRSAASLVEDSALLDKLAAICEIPGVMEGAFAPTLLRAAARGAGDLACATTRAR